MIKKLRNKFIRIAMLSVTLVMLLLTAILNIAVNISTTNDLDKTIDLISSNNGNLTINDLNIFVVTDDVLKSAPSEKHPPNEIMDGKPKEFDGKTFDNKFDGPFSIETPFNTRYFVLTFDSDGTLISSKLENIAAVNTDNLDDFINVAIKHGTGRGYYSDYRYLIAENSDGTSTAVFVDGYLQLRSVKSTLLWSIIADVTCIGLVYILVIIFSRKAIDPVVVSVEKQKQFITDASHELKTPLTVISTSMSVLEMEVGQQKWIDKAKLQIEKMSKLINSLVTLSRLDEEEPKILKQEFDISASLNETVESFRESVESQSLSLNCYIQPDLKYTGDESSIRQLASILMENALKYSTEKSSIDFSLAKDHHNIIIKQSNECSPLSEEQTERLFDRFYRPDESRNSSTGGFGVGLSIARSIVEAHKGTIEAKYQDGRIEFTAIIR